jgi:hypothetical protein
MSATRTETFGDCRDILPTLGKVDAADVATPKTHAYTADERGLFCAVCGLAAWRHPILRANHQAEASPSASFRRPRS